MFYVLTDALRNPEDQGVIYAPGEVLSSGAVEYLAEALGIDSFDCRACTTEFAARLVQRQLLTLDCERWLPHYATSPELAEARVKYAQAQEMATRWEVSQAEVDAAAFEVVRLAQEGLDRHYGIYPT